MKNRVWFAIIPGVEATFDDDYGPRIILTVKSAVVSAVRSLMSCLNSCHDDCVVAWCKRITTQWQRPIPMWEIGGISPRSGAIKAVFERFCTPHILKMSEENLFKTNRRDMSLAIRLAKW